MQAELMYRKPSMARNTSSGQTVRFREPKDSRETIHSGHFMVSDFEAEAQDDEDELAVPVPDEEAARLAIAPADMSMEKFVANSPVRNALQLSIETSLNKLFRCMSLAYRQKLTSPKWNRFKGIRIRWKDKIRLNNVIWRCWHMQFILKQHTLVCQFASPLDVDTHNKPEAVVLEGKYWKRKLAAVTAEYKKWRMFYRNRFYNKDGTDMLEAMDMLDWDGSMCSSMDCTSTTSAHGNLCDTQGPDSMMVDADYMELMTDTLFSTISSNQPLYFPDPREIARGASIADFIQPSLGPLQPNLDDFMDTLEPLQEFLNSKLPPVPEEEDIFRSGALTSNYSELDLMAMGQVNPQIAAPTSQQTPLRDETDLQNLQYTAKIYTQPDAPGVYRGMDYSARQPYDPSGLREKIARTGRSTTRNSRVVQQAYPPSSQQQIVSYQAARQPYSPMDLAGVSLSPATTQVAVGTLTPASASQLSTMERLVTPSPNFTSTNDQSRSLRPLATLQPLSDPFKIVQPQSIQLQCKPTGLDLTAPALHPTKLLPRLPPVNSEKEEIFAVPKYQMKARSRSRSSSALSAPRNHPPPLVSAISDPALNLNQNALLAQLLTSNSSSLYTVTSGPEKSTSSSTAVKSILPMPANVATTHITTPITVQTLHSAAANSVMLGACGSPGSPKDSAHSPAAPSISPLHSPMSVGSPLSPSRSKAEPERGKYNEQRRVGHIHAEQKRRYNIKNGFDMLHSLIPQLNQSSNTKISKAALLQKGADYIRQLRLERNLLKEEMDSLKHQIECLNTSISNSQSMLPATGAPVSRQKTNKMKEMFDEYVRKRTRENWKFWIFSILLEPLMISFNSSVSTANVEDLCRSTILWVDQHCSLVHLRPAFLNSLRYLSTSTDILSDPSRLPDEALAAVNGDKHRPVQ